MEMDMIEEFTREEVQEVPPPLIIDAMSRQIRPGDIITWKSGGYFSNFLSFGLVLYVNREKGYIQILNHNKNKVNLWHTHLCVIIAREPDYSLIPEEYLETWNIIERS